MPTHLNRQNREAIQHAILKATFDPREAALKAQHPQLAQRAYEAAMPEGFIAAAAQWPADWLNLRSCIELRINGQPSMPPLNDRGHYYTRELSLPGPRPFPGGFDLYGTPIIKLDAARDAELIAALELQYQQEFALLDERHRLADSLSRLLLSCKTVEKFIELAPELAPLIPQQVKNATQRAGLPAVTVHNLIADLTRAGLTLPEAA